MKELINFFKNKTVQKQILGAFGGLFLFIILIFLLLNFYTRHGQALTVPDFTGKSLQEAKRIADEKNLRIEVTDSLFIQGQEPGTITVQNPSVNTKVKSNRTIFVTINAINPEKISMPNIVKYSLREAQALLLSNRLKLGQVTYVPNQAKDFVLQQYYKHRVIAPGSKVVIGSVIDVTVGFGLSNENVSVPQLTGLSLETAQEEISGKYLSFGAIVYDNSVETYMDTLNAVIWNQNPKYGSYLNMGGNIDVYLTIDESKVKKDSTATE